MRIRTIKPEFFTHEGLFDAEASTGLPLRVAFIGLWCVADREGKFRWEPRRLGVQILPYDQIDFSDVLDGLGDHGFIIRSSCGAFGSIPSFLDHQCPNLREVASTIPDDAFTCEHVQACEPHYKYQGVNIPPKLREFVFSRDGHKCVRCGSKESLTVDHIFPRSIGGTHAKQNLRTLCRSCNSARPVAGQSLVEDLAKDGFTLNDKSSTCMHVQARVEGKGKEGKGKEGKDSSSNPVGFDDFWAAYPRKIGKGESIKVWIKVHPPLQQVLATLEWQCASGEWTRDGGRYIPHPATWLNRAGWDDQQTVIHRADAQLAF